MDFEITVKGKKRWSEVFNSDSLKYWGAGGVYNTEVKTEVFDKDEKIFKIFIKLPPLAGIILK
jgi:1,4-alpha-glucan branching enzyme